MKAKKKVRKAYKEKHRKMLQLIRKRAERRKKMKNSEKKIVKEDGENKHVQIYKPKAKKGDGKKRETHHVT